MRLPKNESLSVLALAMVGLLSCQTADWGNSKTSTQAPAKVQSSRTTTSTRSSKPNLAASKQTVEASARVPRKNMLSSSQAFPTGDPKSSALLVEKFVPREVQVGQTFEYETRITNLTSLPLDNVLITESMDANFRLESATPSAAMASGAGRWMIGDLGPNESRSIVVKGTAKSAKAIQSCVSAEYESALCTSIPVVAPALELVAMGPTEVLACEEIVYTYKVTNSGTGTASGVVVKGNLPTGLTTAGRTAFSKSVGNLAAGKSAQFEIKVDADRAGRFQHKASAEAEGRLTAESRSIDTAIRQPKLEISIKGTKTQFANRDLKYEITVKNVGDGIAKDTVLQDSIPSGSTFASASDSGKKGSNSIRWSLGNLAPNQARTVSVRYKSGGLGRVNTLASVKAYCAPEASARAETEVRGIPAILLEVVDLEDPIEVGQNETYVITVTNQGTAPATNVKIAVTIPDSTTYVSTTGSTKARVSGTATRRFELEPVKSLAPKAKSTWRIVVKGTRAADARFRISMTSDQLTSPVDETEATNFYE